MLEFWIFMGFLLSFISRGNDIHVIAPTAFILVFNDKLTVNHTYTVSNFKVQANDLVFKPSSHNYMVKFTKGTPVNDVNKHVILAKSNKFTSFAYIVTKWFKKGLLIGLKFCLYT